LAEQQKWREPGDYDRMAAAFARIQQQGVPARMNFTCCQTCGIDEIDDERTPLRRAAAGEYPWREWGYTFFTSRTLRGWPTPRSCSTCPTARSGPRRTWIRRWCRPPGTATPTPLGRCGSRPPRGGHDRRRRAPRARADRRLGRRPGRADRSADHRLAQVLDGRQVQRIEQVQDSVRVSETLDYL